MNSHGYDIDDIEVHSKQVLERIWQEGLEGNFKDWLCVFSRTLNVFTDEAFNMSSSNLFQHVTTRTLKACWRRRLIHCYWSILKECVGKGGGIEKVFYTARRRD